MSEPPLPPHIEYDPPCKIGKVLVSNGDMHGRAFLDMQGNWVRPGQCAYLNRAHAKELQLRNRFWRVISDTTERQAAS